MPGRNHLEPVVLECKFDYHAMAHLSLSSQVADIRPRCGRQRPLQGSRTVGANLTHGAEKLCDADTGDGPQGLHRDGDGPDAGAGGARGGRP